MDFTLRKYKELLQAFQAKAYRFITFEQFCVEKEALANQRFVILRHDVDLRAGNALLTARIEQGLDIKASYYFRAVAQSNKPDVIIAVADLGHEIGYHYEDLSICNGDTEKAICHFKKQLDYFRQYYPVKTICMHGSPRSKFDSRELWKQFDYHDFGIVGEPYFDVDFSKVFYLTDTGRRWDGFNVSIRDKVPEFQSKWLKQGLVYHKTDDILDAMKKDEFPSQLLLTTHPQRWTNNMVQWMGEYVTQSAKNVVKSYMVSHKLFVFLHPVL